MGENMLTYINIATTYGQESVNSLKYFSKVTLNLCKQKNRRIFLLRCKNENVTPTFLNLKTKHILFNCENLKHKFADQVFQNFKKATLDLLISDTTKNINILEKEKNNTLEYLKTTIPFIHLDELIKTDTNKKETIFIKIREKNVNKINKLLKNSSNEKNKFNPNWIENLTNIDIPEDVSEILSLGPNYATPFQSSSELPIADIISSIETSIFTLNSETKDTLRSTVCNIITNYKNNFNKNCKNSTPQKNITKKLNRTKSFLKTHKDLKILVSDKSNKTVIMHTHDYNNKMSNLLQDSSTYKQIKNDPTNAYQKNNNELITKWENKMYISPDTAKKLKIQNSQPPKIYGLPKLHKENIPLRPIVSCIQSPFENLSKFLKNNIQNIVNSNKYYIKDSTDFKSKIKNINIPDNYILISLDVISLYTNIPINLTKNILTKKWEKIKQYTDLPLNEFLNAVELTLNSTYFVHNENFFKQIEGCAMGASISSVIAQLVLEDLEETVLKTLNFELPFFFRYVDDCITAIPPNQYNSILKEFNSYHPKLQFTIEKETENKINFLDLTLHHQKNKIVTEWFTKKTWSSRYLHFNSQHPISQKKTVIIGLADRSIKLSDPQYRTRAINKAKETLKENNYPEKLINKIFKQRIHTFYNHSQTLPKKSKNNNKYISLPYIPTLSEKFQNVFRNYNITVSHKGNNLLKNHIFTPLKAKIPKDKKPTLFMKSLVKTATEYILDKPAST